MASASTVRTWSVPVNAKINRPVPSSADAGRVAAMFGLRDGQTETLYDGFEVSLEPGQIVAVVGPSGAGKTVLLREVARRVPAARWLGTEALARRRDPPVSLLSGGDLAERLGLLARCGLAEAPALLTPAACLSGGQRTRLALAEALHAALRSGRPELVIADEFAACLDSMTARILCGQVRKLISRSPVALLLATPRSELIGHLRPDRVILKPLRRAPQLLPGPRSCRRPRGPWNWPIVRGTIRDYKALGVFHYLAGPPACHKRVHAVRARRSRRWGDVATADLAAVLVVSPPLLHVRGRNLATGGRYAGPDRAAAADLLNAEVECISRVIVHPTYRGCGLAVRLVRHALATAERPLVEALAAMGQVHPFLERAGMTPYRVAADDHVARLLSAGEAVGLSPEDLAAVRPVRRLLRRRGRKATFLRQELDRCVEQALLAKQRRALADPVAEVCRRTARRYVYYLAETNKEATDACP